MDAMDPLDTELMDREADKDARRKIQFSVPSSVPPQLDPRQVEMIRRRRPTPATLFRLTDPPSPEDDTSPHQWMLAENGALKSKLVNTMTYQPPSLKVVQKMAQAHLSSLLSVDKDDSSSEDEEEKKEKEHHQTDSSKDLSEEIKPLRDEPALPDGLKGNANISHRHRAEEEAKEREEEKGE